MESVTLFHHCLHFSRLYKYYEFNLYYFLQKRVELLKNKSKKANISQSFDVDGDVPFKVMIIKYYYLSIMSATGFK